MKSFFLSVCGRVRRLCGGLAVRLKSAKKAVLRWLDDSAKSAVADCFGSLKKGGYRSAKLLEAIEYLAKGIALAALASFFFDKLTFWGAFVAILWSIAIWLYATRKE